MSFSGLELDDDKIFVIPSSLEKPVKLVFESEEIKQAEEKVSVYKIDFDS